MEAVVRRIFAVVAKDLTTAFWSRAVAAARAVTYAAAATVVGAGVS